MAKPGNPERGQTRDRAVAKGRITISTQVSKAVYKRFKIMVAEREDSIAKTIEGLMADAVAIHNARKERTV